MARAGIFNDTSVSGHYGCTAVMGTLIGGLAARGIEPAWLWPVAEPWQDHAGWLRAGRPDLIVVNGEGTIHHSADPERARTRDLLAVAAQDWGVPVHLVNASVAALDAPAIEAMRRFASVHVRESESRAYLAERGIDARLVPDLSLGLSPPAPRMRDGLVVTDSVIRETATVLRELAEARGGGFESMKPRLGLPTRIRAKIAARLRPAPRRWRPLSDPRAFAARLAGAEAVVTGRFHTVMLAILTDTPFLAAPSNTRKIEAVLGDALGSEARVARPSDLAERLGAGIAFDAAELEALARYRARAAEARDAMFGAIAASAA